MRPSLDARWYWLAASCIAVLAAAMQVYRIGDAIQGFHAFNEGFYLSNGMTDAGRNFFAPITAPLDSNNPFIYPVVLATALRLFGQTTAVARWVSVLASTATVIMTFALAKALYNERIGLVAAAIVAFTPGQMLVGRNIQIDPLMLALMVASCWAFVRAVATQRVGWSVAAGVLLGLGGLTKLPALLLIAAFAVWETWRSRDVSWVGKRSTWVTAAAFAATMLPWYLSRYLSSGQFRSSQAYIAGIGGWKGFGFLWHFILAQIAWMLSPLLAAAVIAAVAFLALKRKPADTFVLSVLGVLFVVFLLYNFHAYYYLPLVPFAAIAVARGTFAAAGNRALLAGVLAAALAVTLVAFSVLELSAKKYTGLPTDQYAALLESKGYPVDTTVFGIDQDIDGIYGPPIRLYAREAGLDVVTVPLPAGTAIPEGKRGVVLTGPQPSRDPRVKFVGNAVALVVAPVLFGRAVETIPTYTNFFDPDVPSIRTVGPWWQFGFSERPAPATSYLLFDIPR